MRTSRHRRQWSGHCSWPRLYSNKTGKIETERKHYLANFMQNEWGCDRRQFLVSLIATLFPIATNQAEDGRQKVLATFDDALKTLQRHPNFANSSVANDEASVAFRTGPERAPIRAPKSSRMISSRAIDLIIASEVSSRDAYRVRYDRPVWPEGESGVTIGIGYDIGESTRAFFKEDWEEYLEPGTLELLGKACGVSGKGAAVLIPNFESVRIPWELAMSQFQHEALPRYVGETEKALENTSALGPDSFGALVSLVYNRGTAFHNPSPRFTEMQELSKNMASKRFPGIPDNIRSMERLWKNKPKFKGIVIRREAEAALFEIGLLAT
jgi:GH24 family phage-related lysozyme (muramidase)